MVIAKAELLLKQLKHSIGEQSKLTVAYSGGLDSTVLLHLCERLQKQENAICLQAVHINHGLSQHANDWQMHCQKRCDIANISFLSKSININRKSRTSVEQQARDARYGAFEQLVDSDALILLGQHQDDQAETYLLQLARGSGGDGLSAMPRDFMSASGHRYIRPLLNISRDDLLAYATAHQLTWVEDESNSDEGFFRNFVRHSVLPVLKQKWPSITTTISRSATHHAQSASVIEEYMGLLSESVIDSEDRLVIKAWQGLSEPTQTAMLRFWLKSQVKQMPSTQVLSQISKMTGAREDAQPQCKWGDNTISRFAGKLFIRKSNEAREPSNFSIQLPESGIFSDRRLPYQITRIGKSGTSPWVKNEAITHCFFLEDNKLEVVYGRYFYVCRLHSKRPSKPIKKWLQELNIPPWERSMIPILIHRDKVLAVGHHIALHTQDENTNMAVGQAIVIGLVLNQS